MNGDTGPLMDLLHQSLLEQTLILPPPVVTELRTGEPESLLEQILGEVPMLPVADGYWDRAGRARRTLRQRKLKARTMDALIAQSCIDADVPLIALDSDFRHFVEFGVKLA
jgi:predicted nucleic acid-binding protein